MGWPVTLGSDIVSDLESAIRREWLVTNGRGSYAFGTVAGIATRSYHGLLVAALDAPVGRTVLVRGLAEWATVAGQRVALHAHEYADGTIDQAGFQRLLSFRLDGLLPVFTYAVGDTLIERRIWAAAGADTTYIRYAVSGGDRTIELSLTPLVTWSDHHALGHETDGAPTVSVTGGSAAIVQPPNGRSPYRLLAPGGMFEPYGRWFRGFRHREETARGLQDVSDAYAIGEVRASIAPGRPFTLILTTETERPMEPEVALGAAVKRQDELLRTARAHDGSPLLRGLVLAADQFLVARDIPVDDGVDHGRTVIAGYPWFNDGAATR